MYFKNEYVFLNAQKHRHKLILQMNCLTKKKKILQMNGFYKKKIKNKTIRHKHMDGSIN
jgi:hypothetical protein